MLLPKVEPTVRILASAYRVSMNRRARCIFALMKPLGLTYSRWLIVPREFVVNSPTRFAALAPAEFEAWTSFTSPPARSASSKSPERETICVRTRIRIMRAISLLAWHRQRWQSRHRATAAAA